MDSMSASAHSLKGTTINFIAESTDLIKPKYVPDKTHNRRLTEVN